MSHKSFKFHFYIAFIVVIVLQPSRYWKNSEDFRISRCYSGIDAVSRTATRFQ